MPSTLASVLVRVSDLKNQVNAQLIQTFYQWMKENQKSEAYQKNNIKAITNFAEWLYKRDGSMTFFNVDNRETVLAFLNSKMKTKEDDSEGKWITTWNDYLDRIKVFYRWIYNYHLVDEKKRLAPEDWTTPDFIKIKHRKTQRISPYSASEIWELEDLHRIVKYEPSPRNKAAIMLLWDLDARNHEVTNIQIRNVRLRENYAEGEIPEGKTGSGPILLTASFPYVRDWLNLHPLKDYPKARLICHTSNGNPITPNHLWSIMNTLKKRIQTLVNESQIENEEEREHLRRLLREKKWNPYCFRHSAITHDSDYLPGYALNKKVRWTMTSKQPARYIKNRMGDTLKRTILEHNGIEIDESKKPRITSRLCPKCNTVNALENNYCSKKDCAYPLTPAAYDEIKKAESETVRDLKEIKEFAALVRNSKFMELMREDK
jgi:integrase/recombinase XerD